MHFNAAQYFSFFLSAAALANAATTTVKTTTTKTLTSFSTETVKSTRTKVIDTTSTSTHVLEKTSTAISTSTKKVPLTSTLTKFQTETEITTRTRPVTVTNLVTNVVTTTSTRSLVETTTNTVSVDQTVTNLVTESQTSTLWNTVVLDVTTTMSHAACATDGSSGGSSSSSDPTAGACPGADGHVYSTQNGERWKIICGRDFGNNGIVNMYSVANTLENCIDQCSAIQDCVTVAWIPLSQAGGGNNCYPKRGVQGSQPSSIVDSAVLLSALPSGGSGSYSTPGYFTPTPTFTPVSTPTPSPPSSCAIPNSAQCFNIIGHGHSSIEGKKLGSQTMYSSPSFSYATTSYWIDASDGLTYSTHDPTRVMCTNTHGGGSNWMAFLPQSEFNQGSESWRATSCTRSNGNLSCIPQGSTSDLVTIFPNIPDDRRYTPMFGAPDRNAVTITLTTQDVPCPCGGNVAYA